VKLPQTQIELLRKLFKQKCGAKVLKWAGVSEALITRVCGFRGASSKPSVTTVQVSGGIFV